MEASVTALARTGFEILAVPSLEHSVPRKVEGENSLGSRLGPGVLQTHYGPDGCDNPPALSMSGVDKYAMLSYRDILESALDYRDRVPQRYDTKPAYMVPYEDNDDGHDQGPFPVWENPSRNTFKRIIENGSGAARGLIYDDGRVLIWDQLDLFHSDVGNAIQQPNYISMQFYPKEASCKGDQMDPVEYHGKDEEVIRQALRRYYPEGFPLTEFDWR